MLVEGSEPDPKADENGNSEVVIVSSVPAQSTAGPPQGVMTSSSSSSTGGAAVVVYNGGGGDGPPGMSGLEYVGGGGVGPGGHPAPDAPDTKEGIEELCPVCGDKVSGYHYGLLTCESCKGFFKRTVQNKKVYTCVADRSCHIDKSQRKRCPYCRFQKCLDVGMKLEAVRADRMRGGRNKFGPMYKRDRARRLQMMRQKQLVRNQCSGNGSDPRGDNSNPMALGPPFGGGGLSSPVYGPASDSSGVKQELIQIPQLSSSTSSPDSSPSPLTTGAQIVASLGGPPFNPGGPLGGGPQSAASLSGASGPEGKPCWLPGSPNAAAGHRVSSPNPSSSPKGAPLYHPSVSHPLQGQGGSQESSLVVPGGAGAGGGTSSGAGVGGKTTNVLLREFQLSIMDEKEWQGQIFSLLQNQSYNQCEVDIFELMCKVIDQSLFSQVDWARNSIFFKDLKVDDQMKLLQHSWSDMLILDHLHQRIHHGLPDETTLANGQKFDLLTLALLGQTSLADNLQCIANKFQELKLDPVDYICLKFMLLLNPDVRGLSNAKLVAEAHEQAQQTLLEYTINCYPQINDKFNQLLQVLPEIHLIGIRGEEYLYFRHLSGSAPTQTLLMEMLHAKKK